MPLIKSISWIRWTIWWKVWENLTPIDIVKFTSAYGFRLQKRFQNKNNLKVVVWKDARPSGALIENIVFATLSNLWINVINIGLSATPTVEIAVTEENADWWIIITASHNPIERNALKLLNEKWEFLSARDWKDLLHIIDEENFEYTTIDKLGIITENFIYDEIHIQKILNLKLVDVEAIQKANLTVVVDAVNSVWWVIIPKLLTAFGVKTIPLYCQPTWKFPHNPEPLPENLTEISKLVVEHKADLWIVVDPDVDRLALVNEDGTMFGEEYTLVTIADYVLQYKKWPTVSNFLSSRALRDVAKKYGMVHRQSSVWEVNVVSKMKEIKSPIGWEWNGWIIYPPLHYGRDSLVGIALFLSHLVKSWRKCSQLRTEYPNYIISKNKVSLPLDINPDDILQKMQKKYESAHIDIQILDGIRIEFEDSRVHFRKSNTEPIIRIYAEAKTHEQAENIAQKVISEIKSFL